MGYESVKKLIEENADDVCDFAPFGEGASDLWIQRAETRLEVNFSLFYVWWLKNYGGGTIYGDGVGVPLSGIKYGTTF